MPTVGEGIVEAIVWYVEDPHAEMPAELADMDPEYRDRVVAALRSMVDAHGADYAITMAADIAELLRR